MDPEELWKLIRENLTMVVVQRPGDTEARIELAWAGKCFDFTYIKLKP